MVYRQNFKKYTIKIEEALTEPDISECISNENK